MLAGRDVFVLMATGSGKSISFQLPPVTLRDSGVQAWSLVICPLISLAEDQVAELNAIGIPVSEITLIRQTRHMMMMVSEWQGSLDEVGLIA